ncbi:CRISPR-associated endonuclease Cas2 [Butyricicoccus sp. 1XD8-22]|nr:CRISPR-associated endonuclease Cas2 [Butyricicoccus sp. 1XD8-22]
MRLVLFFDLPMVSKTDRRIYTKFRKYLITDGFIMLQFSVYVKIFPNRDSLVQYTDRLKRNLPTKGSIRIMSVTEKQYEKMQILIGGQSLQEEMVTNETMVIL